MKYTTFQTKNLLALPDRAALANTYILTLLFCLPFAGTMELFAFMVIIQILFIILVFVAFRKDIPSLLGQARQTHPVTFYLLIAWLAATFISLSIIFTTSTNGWHRLFAIIRQLFLLVEIGFCLSLMRFLLATGKPFSHLLLSFALGVVGMAFLHFSVLYWGPPCDSETWLKDPFLSPNMRDIGDLATVAIVIFGTIFWLGEKSRESLLAWVLFTLCWAYLLWTGGRAAIASTLLVNIATIIVCRVYGNLLLHKMVMTCAALFIAFYLCSMLSIYDWNGIMRFSTDWKPSFNPSADVTSGRMDMWKWSIEAFLQKPWFGLGTYSFYYIPARFENGFWHDHPHNLIIQCLIEWGIVGTALFLALLLSVGITGIKQINGKARQKDVCFLATAAAILILTMGSMLGGSYWDFQPVMILATLFAFFPFLPALIQGKNPTANQ